MHRIQQWKEAIERQLRKMRNSFRPLFHWKYSGVFIPVFFGTGVAMALSNKFAMAYTFFVLFGIWSLCYWLTSDFLKQKRDNLSSRPARRNQNRFVFEARKYFAYEWGVSALIVGMATWFVLWTISTKREFEQDDTFQHLKMDHHLVPGEEDDPMHTIFSITNGGSYAISKRHAIVCETNLAVAEGGTSRLSGMASWFSGGKRFMSGTLPQAAMIPDADSILVPNGDAESEQCLSFYEFKETDCADVTITFWYQLVAQPNVQKEKEFRFVAFKGKTGAFIWSSEPQDSRLSYCAPYFKP